MKRALPLSTRTLVWSFGCMCAVLAVGFFVLDMAIKSLIKDGLKASLERTEAPCVAGVATGPSSTSLWLRGLAGRALKKLFVLVALRAFHCALLLGRHSTGWQAP